MKIEHIGTVKDLCSGRILRLELRESLGFFYLQRSGSVEGRANSRVNGILLAREMFGKYPPYELKITALGV